MCEGLLDRAGADSVIARLEDGLSRPFELAGETEVVIRASTGLAFTDHEQHSGEQILPCADLAMYQAKRAGGDRLQVYDTREENVIDSEAALERDLQGALARAELTTVYQPIVATADGALTGFEALIRWQHPTRGPVPPAVLIRSPSDPPGSSKSANGSSSRPGPTGTAGNTSYPTATSPCRSTSRPTN